MTDWKGCKVRIKVFKETPSHIFKEVEERFYLDTDTLADLFDAYDPRTHEFRIEPDDDPE